MLWLATKFRQSAMWHQGAFLSLSFTPCFSWMERSEIAKTAQRKTQNGTQPRLIVAGAVRDTIRRTSSVGIALLLFSFLVAAQAQQVSSWATDVGNRYWVQPDIVYQVANNQSLKLDVWYQHDVKTPSPTLFYVHGGGWIFGTKEGSVLQFLPFLERGWTVVNVEYRMAGASLAPAAVEDTRCALRWVYRNAKQWHFDTGRLVLMGHSAGGHL